LIALPAAFSAGPCHLQIHQKQLLGSDTSQSLLTCHKLVVFHADDSIFILSHYLSLALALLQPLLTGLAGVQGHRGQGVQLKCAPSVLGRWEQQKCQGCMICLKKWWNKDSRERFALSKLI
jgi:hypothetical protein